MLGTTLPTPMYALYAEHMHFAVLTTTVIYATYAGGVLFALLAFGRWSDAIGRRPVLLAGVVFALVSAAVFLTADSVALLLVGRRRRNGGAARPRWRPSRTSAAFAPGRFWPACSSSTRRRPCA